MNRFLVLCGLAITLCSLCIKSLCSIEGDFAFNIVTFIIIIGMILIMYNYLKSTKIDTEILDIIFIGLLTIISMIVLFI